MPTFRVLVQGSGLDVASPSLIGVRGFQTVRVVTAPTAPEAARVAQSLVAHEWVHGKHSAHGIRPQLAAVEVRHFGLLDRLRGDDEGYTLNA
jgi:hypothetical protein